MTLYEQKFRDVLAEIFQLDQAELDFGIYRIMNQKRRDIEAFLNYRLVPEITAILKDNATTGADLSAMENEVFSHLAKFFGRYYEGGDFVSKRRYKDDAYAIPYSGEEVKLYWANADQYYIKTSEYFKNYAFALPKSRRKVHFVLRDAETEQNNNKAAGNMERRFQLCEEDFIDVEDGEMNIYFTYELMPKGTKQDALIAEAEAKIAPEVSDRFADFAELVTEKMPTERNKTRSLLLKHLQDYTAKNNFDYFIHKDLGGFLRRELDFYIKNEVMFLDDLDANHILEHLAQVKAIKQVGEKIIAFLAQLEDFQKKLWLKKKFVVGCDYCITLDRIPRALYPEIVANDAQRQEWVRLFAIDEIKGDMMTEGYSEPLSEKFLEENQFLVLDTKFFSAEFKHKLVGSMENVDEECNGLLINSENFQALELLQEKYREAVKCVYIDPPYNTGKGDFYYKDNFQNSSWLTMMSERLTLAKSYLSSKSVLLMNMDEHEISNSEILASTVFGDNNDLGTIVWDKRNPKGDSKGIAYQHEYILTYAKDAEALAETCKVQRPKRNAELILSKAKQLFSKKSDTYTIADINKDFSKWINSQIGFSGGERAYNLIDEKGEVYRAVSMAWPNKKQAPKEYFIPLIHPNTNKPCPVPARGWRNPPQTMKELMDKGQILFGKDETTQPTRKYLLRENMYENIPSLVYYGGSDTDMLHNMDIPFDTPKVTELGKEHIASFTDKDSIIFDFFAGSGTYGHSVIKLNKEDGGQRKFILCDMAEYFKTVLKPRIEKVIYSEDWKDGKPVSRKGISQCFKYIRLEQYEDTLNNLQPKNLHLDFKDDSGKGDFEETYFLRYMLDTETKGDLFNLEWFVNPFAMTLKTTKDNELVETPVDMVETFNYLIGLNVETLRYPKDGYCVVEGYTHVGNEHTLVIWRDCHKVSNQQLNEFFRKQAYSTTDSEFDKIYVNGDNTLPNIKTDEEHWKVGLIEEEFKKRMFE